MACSLTAQRVTLYDPNPNQLWNRVHQALHIRVSEDGHEYGADGVDPLLWPRTQYLLIGKSHQQALSLLDEFLSTHAERLISDPVRRAVFQHDLWMLFDWVDSRSGDGENLAECRELQVRLAKIIQRVALSRSEIERLPDNLSDALNAKTLPAYLADLFAGHGPWVCVYPRGGGASAPTHAGFFSQSTFLVFIRLPGGREQTLAYLKQLSEYPEPLLAKRFVAGDPLSIIDNPDLPQFPAQTRVVLLRQMMLLDAQGEIVPTHLTESIQTRLYQAIPANLNDLGERKNTEFDMSRQKLFAKESGGLIVIGPEEKGFSVFMTQGDDPFEDRRGIAHQFGPFQVLGSCATCHEGSGIHSVCTYMCNSRRPQSLSDPPGMFEGNVAELRESYVWFKQQRHDLGLLQGLLSH